MAGIRSRKLDLIFKVIVCVLLVALIGGVTFAIVKTVKNEKTKEISFLSYEVGGLDETGATVQDKASVRLKDYITTDGLTVKIDEKATVTYKVYYYDTDKNFVSVTDALSTDFAETIPETAKYAKILITPTEDNDISLFEIRGYAKQLTVTVNK